MIKPPLHSGSITCGDCGASSPLAWELVEDGLWVGWANCLNCSSPIGSIFSLSDLIPVKLRRGHRALLKYQPGLPSPVLGGRGVGCS